MGLMYNVGVLTSRSSLPIIKVKKIWIITIWQFSHLTLAYILTVVIYNKDELIINIYIILLFFILVGLMGGGRIIC